MGEDTNKEGNSNGEKKSEIAKRIEANPLELEFLKPLPESLDFRSIPNINETRNIWRLGIRKVEETFADLINQVNADFDAKAFKYETVQRQVENNHRYLEQFYVDMQRMLNDKYASIKVERDIWEVEKEQIKSLVKYDSEVISLNVGGTTHLQTEKDVLTSVPGSLLASLFSDMHELKKVDGEVFLDRDGKTFETLVNYLRNERKVFPEFQDKNKENHFYKELHFWGIDSHNRDWQEKYLKKLDRRSFNPDHHRYL